MNNIQVNNKKTKQQPKSWDFLGLYYMKQNAKSDKTLPLNSHVLERVKAWEKLVFMAQVKA
jgi:hypothetical protein